MYVPFDSGQVDGEDIHFVRLQILFDALSLTLVHNGLEVVLFVKIGYITTIQNVIDVLEHLFVDDLGIHEKECYWLVLETSL